MKYLRPMLLAILLAGGVLWLYAGGGRERLSSWEAAFLDFLVAEAREDFAAPAVATSEQVVLVEFRPQDKEEYTTWPPAPLDYIMLLKRLAPHEPEAVVFLEPLQWGEDAVSFIPDLRQALIKFPFVVMGVGVSGDVETTPADAENFAAAGIPVFAHWEGTAVSPATIKAVTILPEKGLRATVQTGFSPIPEDSPEVVRIVAMHESQLVPSVVAQAITLYRRVSFASLRVRLGAGARLTLGNEYVIPLEGDGSLRPDDSPKVPGINALVLLTPEMGDPAEDATKFVLGKGKVVVVSMTNHGDLQARAVASALLRPSMSRASTNWEWSLAAVACGLGLWQLRYRRLGALLSGFCLLVLGVLVSLLVFRSSKVWCPPLPVLLPLTIGTLYCFLWPRKSDPSDPAEMAEPATLL